MKIGVIRGQKQSDKRKSAGVSTLLCANWLKNCVCKVIFLLSSYSVNGVYKTNIYGFHSSLWVKTNGPSVTAIVLFCFGAAPLSKIAQLQSPQAHSFN